MFLAALLALAACGKESPAPASPTVRGRPRTISEEAAAIRAAPNLPPEGKALLIAALPRDRAITVQAASDRQELISPAPAGWRPKQAGLKVELTLVPEKARMRVGERFRYRLEIQNIGNEYIQFFEMGKSFIKDGSLYGHYRFLVTPPGGAERMMEAPMLRADRPQATNPGPAVKERVSAVMTREERAVASWRDEARHILDLYLAPGEILRNRVESASDPFRTLWTSFHFDKPGTYRIRVEYDDLGDHPDVAREKSIEQRMRASHASREQILKWDEEFRIERGVSLDDRKRERAEEVRSYEERRRTSVGQVHSNTAIVEVAP